MVARLMGIVCLAYMVQMHLGQRVSADPVGQRRRALWTVTDRVSWCWCGQRLFDDLGYDWTDWLDQQWESLGWLVVDFVNPLQVVTTDAHVENMV